MKHFINLISGFFGAVLGALVGGLDGLLIGLIVFMIIDYITGIGVAVINKTVSSSTGFKGLFKKMLILLYVIMGNIIDVYIIKSGSTARTAVILFYISNEGISIIENSVKLGLKVPDKLKRILEELTTEDEVLK